MPDKEWGEAFDIAQGLPRAECVRRGQQAFAHANEIRARYTSLLDGPKRSAAISQGLAWAAILEYLDQSGAGTFELDAYQQVETSWVRRTWSRISPVGWYLTMSWTLRAAFGTKPLEFYTPEGVKEELWTAGIRQC